MQILEKIEKVSWDAYFLSLAFLVSTRSKDQNTKCGCVVVDDNKQCFTGYNGAVPGYNDHRMIGPEKYFHILHSEINALNFAGLKHCREQKNLQLFVTFRPCPACALQILNYNVKRVVYRSEYKSNTNDFALLEIIRYRGATTLGIEKPAFTLERYDGALLFEHTHMGIKV